MYKQFTEQLSKELDIPEEVIREAYNSYWVFVRERIKALPLKEDLNEEEFSKLRTNFNVPSLGKLNCVYQRYKGVRKKYQYLKKLKENG